MRVKAKQTNTALLDLQIRLLEAIVQMHSQMADVIISAVSALPRPTLAPTQLRAVPLPKASTEWEAPALSQARALLGVGRNATTQQVYDAVSQRVAAAKDDHDAVIGIALVGLLILACAQPAASGGPAS